MITNLMTINNKGSNKRGQNTKRITIIYGYAGRWGQYLEKYK